jgi:hypothetical protein
VAQLGARFHGMEEVDGSNPSRSTTKFQTLTVPPTAKSVFSAVHVPGQLSRTLRLRAAEYVFEIAMKGIELEDIDARLAALEAATPEANRSR